MEGAEISIERIGFDLTQLLTKAADKSTEKSLTRETSQREKSSEA